MRILDTLNVLRHKKENFDFSRGHLYLNNPAMDLAVKVTPTLILAHQSQPTDEMFPWHAGLDALDAMLA